VKIGVVALRIEATPLATYICPQVSSVKGMTLLMMPMIRNDVHAARVIGSAIPMSLMTMCNTTAAIATRMATTVSGGNSQSAIATKKNEQPQISASSSNKPHSRAFIVRLMMGEIMMESMRAAWL